MDKPAFPYEYEDGESQGGLTRRELFAAMALTAIIQSDDVNEFASTAEENDVDPFELVCKGACELADALIEQLDKTDD